MYARSVGHVFIDHFSNTKSGFNSIHIQRIANHGTQRRFRGIGVKFDRAACKIVWVQLAQHQISIRDTRAFSATTITRGSRFGPCAFWANPDLTHRINVREGSAPCTDLNHVDHRNRNRHARAFFETIRAGNFKDTRGLGCLVFDQTDLGSCAAHIKREHLIKAIARRDMSSKHSTTSGAGFDQTHRKIRSVLNGDNATTGVH